MKLRTKYHGVVDYKEDEIIYFKKGIPGFEKLKKFILFKVEGNEDFSVLHSVEDKSIGLIVISPFYIVKDYEFELDDKKMKELKIENKNEVVVLTTVTLNSKVEGITINLKAPIIINIKKCLGEQIILDNPDYLIKYPIVR
ncbi:flagellar assembly protein FliW [Clostridium fermenticellae]|uniref:Flagellar assembly factor FliW n=1 Tax=Clostridium fermenticellae TaxID=2068654 RepID=A0A386H4Y2_9CLOT|nr:flagellar assembly protein FliW [Clostridium fermenticellae]AYD40716.1 flagellar assembly protein FliW [Clostridium fermenticellae]